MIFGLTQRDLVFLSVMVGFLLIMFAMLVIELYKIYMRRKKNGNGPK